MRRCQWKWPIDSLHRLLYAGSDTRRRRTCECRYHGRPSLRATMWTKLIILYPAVRYSLDAFKTESMRSTIFLILCSKPEFFLAVAIIVFFLCLGAVAYSNSKKGADKAKGQASWRAISTVEEFNKERNARNASYTSHFSRHGTQFSLNRFLMCKRSKRRRERECASSYGTSS